MTNISSAKDRINATQPLAVADPLAFLLQTPPPLAPSHRRQFIAGVFAGVQRLFAGDYPGYQASDTAFHDFAHTCDVTIAVARILDGHRRGQFTPPLTERDVDLALASALLHDTGYLKRCGDTEGTGAKYTVTHVPRSIEFVAQFLPAHGATAEEIGIVQRAIACTAPDAVLEELKLRDDRERYLGCALATGDLLGQMAAPDYPERLPALYAEFAEGIQPAAYTSATDLMRKTRGYYDGHAQRLLTERWGGAYCELEHHFSDGQNHYLLAIARNLDRIDQILAAARTST